MDERVALREARVVQMAPADRPLVVADRHAAVEGVDHTSVPERGVWWITWVARRRQDRGRVDETVDRPALAAHHIGNSAAVERGRRHNVRGKRARWQRFEGAVRR